MLFILKLFATTYCHSWVDVTFVRRSSLIFLSLFPCLSQVAQAGGCDDLSLDPASARYTRTNRASIDSLLKEGHSPQFLTLERIKAARGVVDLGCGFEGSFVLNMRRSGVVDIVGVDRALRRADGEILIQMDARRTGLPANRYGMVISTQSLLSYDSGRAVKLEALAEARRLLRADGLILAAPMSGFEVADLVGEFTDLSLELLHFMERPEMEVGVVLKKLAPGEAKRDRPEFTSTSAALKSPYQQSLDHPHLTQYFRDPSLVERLAPSERGTLRELLRVAGSVAYLNCVAAAVQRSPEWRRDLDLLEIYLVRRRELSGSDTIWPREPLFSVFNQANTIPEVKTLLERHRFQVFSLSFGAN